MYKCKKCELKAYEKNLALQRGNRTTNAKILKVSAQSDFVWVKNDVLLYSLSCQ